MYTMIFTIYCTILLYKIDVNDRFDNWKIIVNIINIYEFWSLRTNNKCKKKKINIKNQIAWNLMACLVYKLKHIFSVFKQYYIHFHTFFHLHVFQKNTNNITQTPLPNGPLIATSYTFYNNLCFLLAPH